MPPRQFALLLGLGCCLGVPWGTALLAETARLEDAWGRDRVLIQDHSGARQLASRTGTTPVRLKSGMFVGTGDLQANLTAALGGVAGAEQVHVLVQFASIPGQAARDRLAEAGVKLLAYVPDSSYFATIRKDADLAAFVAAGGRWLGQIYPEDKLSESLRQGRPGVWARLPAGTVRVRVRLFEDTKAGQVEDSAAVLGAVVSQPRDATGEIGLELAEAALFGLASIDGVQWVEEVPPPMDPFNDGVRTNIQAVALLEAPYSLAGTGVAVGVWDAGWLDFTHPDFAGRAFQGEAVGPAPNHFHATHVAGTLAGSGASSADEGGLPGQWRGVAPGATVVSYDVGTGSIVEEHRDARDRFGAVISQNSWGVTVDSFFGNCHLLGNYTGDALNYDRLTTGLVGGRFTVVFAVGNARGRRDSSGCPSPDGYNTVGVPATGKNIITVGAVNSDDSAMTVFSGWGPTDDGRLKPEVVGPGDEVGGDGGITSTQPNGVYGTLVGTSMAAPAVSGVAALLVEDYRQRYNAQNPLPSTLKALLVHTAIDLNDENPWFEDGPDYASGYGRVQAQDAVDHLRSGGLVIGQVAHGGISTYWLDVPAGTSQVKVTLAWDDVAAVENATRTLVNDLDLVVTDPDGTRHFPWTLDPANPAAPAVRSAEDHLNNLEQVRVDAGITAGRWVVSVAGGNVPSGSTQKFTLLFSPAVNAAVPLIVMEQALASDSGAGNSNGFVDRGEEIVESIRLRNTDGPTASGVEATLSSTSPWIRMLDGQATYPDLKPGEAADSLTPFRYRVSKDTPCGHAFVLEHVASLGEYRFTNLIERVVGRLEVTNTTQRAFAAGGLPLAIPDDGTLRAELPVTTRGTVHDVNVRVRLDHTWLDDLELKLRHPNGTEVLLVPALSNFGENFGQGECGPDTQWTSFDDSATLLLRNGRAPFVGNFRPAAPLSQLADTEMAGTWELLVTDVTSEDTGWLRCWELEIAYAENGYLCEFFNRPPVARESAETFYVERPDWLVLNGLDPDDDPLAFRIVVEPEHGRLEDLDPLTGRVRYLPAPGYVGPDAFVYALGDGHSSSEPTAVTLDIQPATLDLILTQEISGGTITHGQSFEIGLTVTNRGPSDAREVELRTWWPEGLELLSSSASQGTVQVLTEGLLATLGTVPEHGTAQVLISGRLADPAWVTNLATVSATGIELTPADNTSMLEFPIVGTANLALGAQAAPDPSPVNAMLELAYAVTNLGPHAASNVVFRSALPASTGFNAVATSRGEASLADGIVVGVLGTLGVGETAEIRLQVMPGTAGFFEMGGEVASDLPDPDVADNTARAVAEVRHSTDLGVAWGAPAGPVAVGDTFTHIVSVTNQGPVDADQVTAGVSLAPGVELLGLQPAQGTAESAAGVISWTVGTLPTGTEVSLGLELRLLSAGVQTNLAAVSAYQFELTPADNSAGGTVDVRPETDLQVLLETSPAPHLVGIPFSYLVTLTNAGPLEATAVLLEQELPAGLETQEILVSQGDAAVEGTRLRAALGSLPVGSVATLSVRGSPLVAGEMAIEVRGQAFEVDPEPANNTALQVTPIEEHADLELSLEFDPTDLLFSRETWSTITVTNRGPFAAAGVTVLDQLPEALSLLGVEASQGTVQADGGSLAFDFGTLAAGQVATGRLQLLPGSPGLLTHRAWLTSTTSDLVADNNAAEASVQVRPAVNVGVLEWLATTPVVLGHDARLQLTLTNRGPHTATEVAVAYTFPAGADLVAASSPAGDCTGNGATLACRIPELASGGVAVFELVLRLATPDPLAVQAQVASLESDLEPTDNAAEFTLSPGREANLVVGCMAAPASVLNGGQIAWSLAITNLGPAVAEDAMLTLAWPEGAAALEAVETTQGTTESTAEGLMVRLGTMEVDTTAMVRVTLDAENAGTFLYLASVSSAQYDLEPANNTCESSSDVLPAADLDLRNQITADPAALHLPARCLITVTNRGPDAASGVRVTKSLADAFAFLSATPSVGSYSLGSDELVWEVGNLEAGQIATLEMILEPLAVGQLVSRSAVTAVETDPESGNNLAEATTYIRYPADLSLSVSEVEGQIPLNRPATYVFSVRNLGPSPASSVTFEHLLPIGLQVRGLEASAGTVDAGGGAVFWQLPDMAPEATASLAITVATSVGGRLTGTARVSAYEADIDPSNNHAQIVIQALGQAELSLRQQVSPGPALLGQTIQVDLVLTNAGPEASTDVLLTNELPSALTLQQVQITQGTIWTNGNQLEFHLGTVPAGSEARARLEFHALTLGSHTNHAGVTATESDLFPDDNSSSVTIAVLPAAELALAKTLLGRALVGAPLRYRLELTNAGPSTATGAQVRDVLPPGLEFVSAETDRGTYVVDQNELVYEPGALEAGASAGLTLVVLPTAPGQVTNSAQAVAFEADPLPDNNLASVVADVRVGSDLEVRIHSPLTSLLVGRPGPVIIALSNRGPQDIHEIALRVELPNNVNLGAVSLPDGTWDRRGDTLFVTLPRLPVAGEIPLELSLTPLEEELLTLTASASAATEDIELSNNFSEFTLEVNTGSDLALQVWPDFIEGLIDHEVSYAIVITNRGPVDATGVTVSSILPGRMSLVAVQGNQGTWTAGSSLVTGNIGVLPAGREVWGVLTYKALEAGEVSALARVTSTSSDPDETNNEATFAGVVYPAADLLVVQEPLPPQLLLGDQVEVVVLVTNRGALPSPRTQLLVAFSLNVELVSAEVEPDTVPSYIAPPGVLCNLGTFDPGDHMRLTVRIRPTDLGRMVSQATVVAPALDPAAPGSGHRLEAEIVATPTLVAERSGSRLLLSWPVDAEEFALESKELLTDPEWQPVLNPRQIEGDRYVVNLKQAGPLRFFRLRKSGEEAQHD